MAEFTPHYETVILRALTQALEIQNGSIPEADRKLRDLNEQLERLERAAMERKPYIIEEEPF